MLSDKVRNLATGIGNFYLLKNEGDYARTERELLALGITKLEFLDHNEKGEPEDSLHITLNRPGLLIGRKGSNVDALTADLKVKIIVHEDTDSLLSALIPYDPFFDEDGDYQLLKKLLLG